MHATRTRRNPAAVAELVRILCGLGGHEFWSDDITLLDPNRVDIARLLESNQVTDSYLLALASAHAGKLATFDHHLVTTAVIDGPNSLHMIR